MRSKILKILLPFVILVAGVAGSSYMMRTKVAPERQVTAEMVAKVEAEVVTHQSEQVMIKANGTVTASREVQLRPEVTGRIVELSDRMIPGGLFTDGEVLAQIDDRDYQATLAARKEALAGAELRLQQEQARQAVAEEEWQLLSDSIPANQSNRDLALRLPQIEQAEAAVEAALAAVAKADLDLERCTLKAPFDAVVLRESIDLGQVVNPQTTVASLAGTGSYWVQVSLPVAHLAWIDLPGHSSKRPSPARITFEAGSVHSEVSGRVARLLGDVDPAGRLARLLIVIDDPLRLRPGGEQNQLPLLLGSYVAVDITGREMEDVIRIPREALRELRPPGDGSAVEGLWIMDSDDRLRTRKVEVVWRSTDSVLISNSFADGDRIVTSAIPTPIEGMKLRLIQESPALEASSQ